MINYRNDAVMYLYYRAMSDKSKANASLELLLDQPVGIGDHTTDDLYGELDKALDILVDAEDRLEILTGKYGDIVDKNNRYRPEGNAPF